MSADTDMVDSVAEALWQSDGFPGPLRLASDETQARLKHLARAALDASGIGELVEQTLLVDRLCTAIDQAAEDIGHESIDDLLKLIGPQNERCIEALGGRAALSRARATKETNSE